MSRYARSKQLLICLALIGLAGLLIACGVGGLTAAHPPRWACPSPTPKPWGARGPIKDRIELPTAEPSGPQEYKKVYYDEWEQEYGDLGGPPFPSPTPYSVTGLNYALGQRVEVWPFQSSYTSTMDGPLASNRPLTAKDPGSSLLTDQVSTPSSVPP